jgi:hypothetical protein
VVIKTVVNSDPGDADHVGGNDWDNLATALNLGEAYKYYITKSGSTYYAKNSAGEIADSNSDAATVIQNAITATLATSRGGYIVLAPFSFSMNTYLDIPTAVGPKPVGLIGTFSNDRNTGSTLSASSSFPDNHSIIETSGATDGSLKSARVVIRDLGLENVANYNTKTIGGIKFETDYAAARRQLIVEHLYGQYLHKGLTLQGPLWWSIFNNINFDAFNSGFVGSYDIKLESTGTYTHTTAGVGNWPKSNIFRNVVCVRNPGTMAQSLYVKAGGYNVFYDYMVDGITYTDCVWRFGDSSNLSVDDNIMYGAWDEDNPESGGEIGKLVLEGTDTYNNQFYNSRLGRLQYMVTIKGGAFRNFIETAGYWGAHVKTNVTGCGEYNVIQVMDGALGSGSTSQKLNITGAGSDIAKLRVIDRRKDAYRRGISTQSGNASTVAFNIAHGLMTTPVTWTITPQTTDALGPFYVTATSTNLVVNYPVAPPSGTNNLTWSWTADIYGDT